MSRIFEIAHTAADRDGVPTTRLRVLNRVVMNGEAKVILEADITSYFDSLDRLKLLEFLQERIPESDGHPTPGRSQTRGDLLSQ